MMPPLRTAVSTRAALLIYKKKYGKHQTEEKQTNQPTTNTSNGFLHVSESILLPSL